MVTHSDASADAGDSHNADVVRASRRSLAITHGSEEEASGLESPY